MIALLGLLTALGSATVLVVEFTPATLETMMIGAGLLGATVGVLLGGLAVSLETELRSGRDSRSEDSVSESAR